MNTIKNYLATNDTRFVIIDGNICATIQQFYTTIQYQLQLPDYFGNNLDALEEILYDLEWIEESNIQFIIINENEFLQLDKELKPIVLDIISNEANTRISISYI